MRLPRVSPSRIPISGCPAAPNAPAIPTATTATPTSNGSSGGRPAAGAGAAMLRRCGRVAVGALMGVSFGGGSDFSLAVDD